MFIDLNKIEVLESDSKFKDEFIKNLSIEMKVERESLELLYNYLKKNFFYILFVFEGLKINFLTINKINKIIDKIIIKNFILKNKDIDEKLLINRIEDKFLVSKTKAIKILRELERNGKNKL